MVPGLARARRQLSQSPLWDDRFGILAVVSLGWFLLLGVRLVIPALFPQIRAEFVFSATVAGSLYTVLLAVAAILQFPGGIIADRVGGRSVLFLGCGAGFAGALLLSAAPLAWVFVLGVILFGVGSGLYGTPRVTVLSTIYPDRDATAIGICSASGNLGTTILPVVAGFLTAAVGWRFGLGFALPFFLISVALLWWYVPADAGKTDTTQGARKSARVILGAVRDPSVLLVTAVMGLTFFVYQGVTAFLPTYLIEMKSLPDTTAATLFGLFFAGGVVFQVFGGNIGDRFGYRRTMIGLLLCTVVTLLLLPFTFGSIPLTLLVIAASVQLGFWPVVFSYTVAILPGEVQSSGLGLLRTFYLLFGALGSTAVGIFADADAFDGAFYFLGILVLVAAGCCLFLPSAKHGGD